MSSELYADVVATVVSKTGFRKYVKVGAMLKMGANDANKGPGFVIMLDRHFNPAGLGDGDSVALSTYWPKEAAAKTPAKLNLSRPHADLDDDDIPF